MSIESNLALAIILPFGVAFAVTAIATALLIPALVRFKNTQPIYEDAPEQHQKKRGTPTMGGIALVFGIVAGTVCIMAMQGIQADLMICLSVTLAFALLGFVDDYQKIANKRNMGFRARHKLLLQVLIALIMALYFVLTTENGTTIIIPFAWKNADLGYGMIVYIVFITVAMVNAVNLTDGLDGLASSVSATIALFYPVFVFLSFQLTVMKMDASMVGIDRRDLADALFFAAVGGACLGFLIFNRHPAKIFMGDTGSLALGGGLATAAIFTRTELLLPIAGAIFVMEALSDILQVGSYKLRHGKRIFRMAPLHHHFELGGWSEVKVVGVFAAVTILLCGGASVAMLAQM
ncbi:MAG: phospho-N-acetylmuramoyl-pentapeptide-transferase [Clostridiales Family XIII bacterium]|nr:phospho-N-acetylmuramoyl-pentapeptide-transferase [Clostridiales Family XIII bacterium]